MKNWLKFLRFVSLRPSFLRASQLFFGVAIFLIPLRLQSLVYSTEAYQLGFFNEYTAIFIHVSELLFLVAFGLLGLAFMRGEKLPPDFTLAPLQKFAPLFLPLLAFSVAVIPFAADPLLALFFFWQLLGLLAAAAFLATGLFDRTLFIKIFVAAFFFQAVLAIGQYLAEGALGAWWLGESLFDANTFNVAKVVLPSGEIAVRGMGTLAHANIFGGLVAIALLLLAALARKSMLAYFAALTLLSGMFFSFSRAAYLAFFVGLAVLLIFQFRRRLVSITIATILFAALVFAFGDPFFVRFGESAAPPSRSAQITTALEIARDQPLGVGRGSYTTALSEQNPRLAHFQLQPVHNFFALKLVEESAAVALAWLAIFVVLAINAFRRKKFTALALLATAFVLANFDHYLADSFVGEASLLLLFGFVVAELSGEKDGLG